MLRVRFGAANREYGYLHDRLGQMSKVRSGQLKRDQKYGFRSRLHKRANGHGCTSQFYRYGSANPHGAGTQRRQRPCTRENLFRLVLRAIVGSPNLPEGALGSCLTSMKYCLIPKGNTRDLLNVLTAEPLGEFENSQPEGTHRPPFRGHAFFGSARYRYHRCRYHRVRVVRRSGVVGSPRATVGLIGQLDQKRGSPAHTRAPT
jgi:hypothetical protein